MDACGAHTPTLDNHHSHDSDRRNTERLTSPGQGQGDTSSGKTAERWGVGGSAWHATPDWETEPKDAGLNHAADCIEQALAKLRIAEDRVSTELSTRLEP
jgi:hypothetical protein